MRFILQEVANFRILENAYLDKEAETNPQEEDEFDNDEEDAEDEADAHRKPRDASLLRLPIVVKADNVSSLASILETCRRLSTSQVNVDVSASVKSD